MLIDFIKKLKWESWSFLKMVIINILLTFFILYNYC